MLLAIIDADNKFIYIDVGAFGKESDSRIFENSPFNMKLQNNELNIPGSQPLPGTDNPKMSFTYIGDEAFSLSPKITTKIATL